MLGTGILSVTAWFRQSLDSCWHKRRISFDVPACKIPGSLCDRGNVSAVDCGNSRRTSDRENAIRNGCQSGVWIDEVSPCLRLVPSALHLRRLFQRLAGARNTERDGVSQKEKQSGIRQLSGPPVRGLASDSVEVQHIRGDPADDLA